jgi:hypothetical protein
MRTRVRLGLRASNLELIVLLGISGLLRNYLEPIECSVVPVTLGSQRHCEERDFRSTVVGRTLSKHLIFHDRKVERSLTPGRAPR